MKTRQMLAMGCVMVLIWHQVVQAQSPRDGRMTGGATTRPVSGTPGPAARPVGAGRAAGHLGNRPMAGVNRYDASGRRIGQSIPWTRGGASNPDTADRRIGSGTSRPPGGASLFDRFGRRTGYTDPSPMYGYNYYDPAGRQTGSGMAGAPGGPGFFDRYDRYGRRVGHVSPPASGTSRYDYNYYPR